MRKDDVLSEMARVWVDAGGDAEEILWLSNRLSDAVLEEIERRKTKESES